MTESTVQTWLSALLLPVLSLAGVSVAACFDPYLKKGKRRVLLGIIAVVLSLLLDNCLARWLEGVWRPEYAFMSTALSAYAYAARPAVIVLFVYLAWDDPRRRLFWVPAGVNAAVYLTALFEPWTFRITEDGLFFRGPLGYTAHWVSGLLLASMLAVTLRQFRHLPRAEMAIPVLNACVAALGPVMDANFHQNGVVTFAELTTVFCVVFFYIWLHLQYVAEHERALIEAQRLKLMVSQIKPHFLFNTLTAIRAQYLDNPRKAAAITDRFAAYLRRNIDSLNDADLIPFRKELDHALVYAEIELESLPGVSLDYEIEDEDFLLPALTLQPLVENAIRHGVRGVAHGQVLIATALREDCHEIVVSDNGVGFDAKTLDASRDGHIGIRNVRERLRRLCGGTLTVVSAPGAGTAVTMRIPIGKERS